MLELIENFVRLRRALSLAHVQQLKPLGLGSKQAIILRALAKDGPCSAVELARATVSDPAAINRTVAGLIKKGLLRQRRDADDGRRCRLSLTPGKGHRMAAKVLAQTRQLADRAAKPLSPAERQRFIHDLQRLTEHLNAELKGSR
jgi:DNA-binding MarR family transcriptional regulator